MPKYRGADTFVECLGIRRGEKVFILSDIAADKRAVEIIAKACKGKTRFVDTDYSLPIAVADELPARLMGRLFMADCIILATHQSWYHAPFRQKLKHVLKKRVVDCYGCTPDMLERGALDADWMLLKKINAAIAKVISNEGRLRITSKNGTEVSARFSGIVEESGAYQKPASGGNLPAGEIALRLLARSAEGRVVFDLSFDGIGRLKRAPLEINILDSAIVGVEGAAAPAMKALLHKDGRIKHVAEIALGTNPFSITGRSVLEDEKKLGTVHFGFGNDTYFGGRMSGPHYDGVLEAPTVTVDERVVLENGRIVRSFFHPSLSRRLAKSNIFSEPHGKKRTRT